jgi:hypothetical protein
MLNPKDPYIDLAKAVVNQAIEDWTLYLIKINWGYDFIFEDACHYATDAHNFLTGDVMKKYSSELGINPDYILETCDRIAHSGSYVRGYLKHHPEISPFSVALAVVNRFKAVLWAHDEH